jgi:hypothetical protein
VTAPSSERLAALRVLLLEAALAGHAGNGTRLPDDLSWLAVHDAVRSPATAARCPNLRAVLPPGVAAAVTRLAAEASQAAGSEPLPAPVASPAPPPPALLSTAGAAAALGVTSHAVAAACRRGSLPAVHGGDGRWVIAAADLEEYGRTHGKITR